MARTSGASPYDMARLLDDYPDVFEEYAALFDRKRETFGDRRAKTRTRRLARIFGGMTCLRNTAAAASG